MPELWEKLYRVADAAQPKFKTALLDLFDNMRGNVNMRALQQAMRSGNTLAAWNAIPWRDVPNMEANQELTEILSDIFKTAGSKTMADLMRQPSVNFEAIDEDTAAFWAQNEGSYLITHIQEQTRTAVQQAVSRAFIDGKQPPKDQIFSILQHAANLRDDLGLNQQQMYSLNKYRQQLFRQGVSGFAFTNAISKYRTHLLKYRADMISRTETIQAAAEGQRAVWDMQVAEGRMDPSRWEVEWLTTPDDVTCQRCMRMNHQRRPIDGYYWGAGLKKPVKGPTLHPNCRCTERLVPRKGRPVLQKTKPIKKATKITVPKESIPKVAPITQAPVIDGVEMTWPSEVARDYPEMMNTIGDVIKIENYDLDRIRAHVRQLSMLPTEMLRGLRKAGVKWHIKDSTVTKMDNNQSLSGVRPRGWSEGSTWDEVPGVYSSGDKWACAGTGDHGCTSLVLHETGHAVGDMYYVEMRGRLVNVQHSEAFIKIHKELYPKLGSYYQQDGPGGYAGRQELFAESFGTLMRNGGPKDSYAMNKVASMYNKKLANYLKYVIEKGGVLP